MSDSSDSSRRLTRRQRQVLQQAALGLSNRQIGEVLVIAEQTVKNHLSSAMRKMSLHDRTHAVVVAIGQGWINIPVAESARPRDGSVNRPDPTEGSPAPRRDAAPPAVDAKQRIRHSSH